MRRRAAGVPDRPRCGGEPPRTGYPPAGLCPVRGQKCPEALIFLKEKNKQFFWLSEQIFFLQNVLSCGAG